MKLYIARDEDGYLALYSKKPIKSESVWRVDLHGQEFMLPEHEFPEVRWEDTEAREVEIKIRES